MLLQEICTTRVQLLFKMPQENQQHVDTRLAARHLHRYRCTGPLKALHPVQWQPTREGYLRFLVESKEVYNTLESIVADAQHSHCKSPACTYSCSL